MKEKPPILSDREIAKALETLPIFRGMCLTDAIDNGDRVIGTTQRDADVAYYEPLVQQIIEEWQDKLVKRDVGWLKQKAIEIRQAKADVAEDIGGLICCLAGNLMLEDKEAGTLLAKQLQPLIDTIKIRYLPHLPRKEMDK